MRAYTYEIVSENECVSVCTPYSMLLYGVDKDFAVLHLFS